MSQNSNLIVGVNEKVKPGKAILLAFHVDFQNFLNLTTCVNRKKLKIARISAVFLAEIWVLCYTLFRFN